MHRLFVYYTVSLSDAGQLRTVGLLYSSSTAVPRTMIATSLHQYSVDYVIVRPLSTVGYTSVVASVIHSSH